MEKEIKLTFWQKIKFLVINPVKAWESINKSTEMWYIPIIVVFIFSVFSVFLFHYSIDYKEVIQKYIEFAEESKEVDEGLIALMKTSDINYAALNMRSNGIRMELFPLVYKTLFWLFGFSFLLWIVSKIFKGNLTYKKTLAIVSFSSVVQIFTPFIKDILVLIKQKPGITTTFDSLYYGRPIEKYEFWLAGLIEPFNLWATGLIIVGFYKLSGVKLKFSVLIIVLLTVVWWLAIAYWMWYSAGGSAAEPSIQFMMPVR